jgi:hypothetical protein
MCSDVLVPVRRFSHLAACFSRPQAPLRASISSAAAAALESAAEVEEAVNADLEDATATATAAAATPAAATAGGKAKKAKVPATDERKDGGAVPMDTSDTAAVLTKPKSKKEAYNLVQQLLKAGPGAAPNRKVLL